MSEMLIAKELPFPMPEVHIDMLWHERDARSPGHRWLRDQLVSADSLGSSMKK
jgi:DNA-binding transcriptional LysR family regulator